MASIFDQIGTIGLGALGTKLLAPSDKDIISPLKNPSIPAPLQNFQPFGTTSPGFTGIFQNGNFNLQRSPLFNQNLSGLGGAFQSQADFLRSDILPQVEPGIGGLTQSRLQQVENARRRSIGNLRENLARRRVLGSSFATDALARAEREFSQESDRVKAESFLQELELKTQLAERAFQLEQQKFKTNIDQLNFEGELGARISESATRAEAANNAALSELLAGLAEAESNVLAASAQGTGEFIGDVLTGLNTANAIGGLTGAVGGLGGLLGKAVGGLGDIVGGIGSAVGGGLEGLGNILGGGLNSLTGATEAGLSGLTGATRGGLESLKAAQASGLEGLSGTTRGGLESLKSAQLAGLEGLSGALTPAALSGLSPAAINSIFGGGGLTSAAPGALGSVKGPSAAAILGAEGGAAGGAAGASGAGASGFGATFGNVIAPLAIGGVMLQGLASMGKKGEANTAGTVGIWEKIKDRPNVTVNGATGKQFSFAGKNLLGIPGSFVVLDPKSKELFTMDFVKGNLSPLTSEAQILNSPISGGMAAVANAGGDIGAALRNIYAAFGTEPPQAQVEAATSRVQQDIAKRRFEQSISRGR